jgi:membrane-bound serine protease (ClpP class)
MEIWFLMKTFRTASWLFSALPFFFCLAIAAHGEVSQETSSAKEEQNRSGHSNEDASEPVDANEPTTGKVAYVIPIRDQIGAPILDVLRRGLRTALVEEASIVILDINTPGGELGVTLEIMQEIIDTLERFDGTIIAYVNREAISAGAYIAIATNEIAFAPMSQIGAAEAVSGGGGDIDSSMKRKINSYLKAKIRSYSGKDRYRAKVMAAMMDANETLLIEGEPLLAEDGTRIQKEGELLTITGEEACKLYGNPPEPLLGIGVYGSVDELLDNRWGKGNYRLLKMKVNWAEKTGLWLNGIAPILLGLGLVSLFIEFKTPGFGVFGVLGLILLLVFFGSKYVAGLAGQEELLVFLLGLCLVVLEVFFFPGFLVPGILGLLMMIGSIFWAMVDVWPNTDFVWTPEMFHAPAIEFMQAIALALIVCFVLSRILPKTPLWNWMVLSETVGGPSGIGGKEAVISERASVVSGSRGVTVSELYPTGYVIIDEERFEARSKLGKIHRGEKIRVVEKNGLELIVEKVE